MKRKEKQSFLQKYWVYLRLWSYLKKYWKIFIISVIAMVITAATIPAFASLMKPLINEGFVEKNMENMRWIPFAIVGLFIVRGVANYVNEYTTSYISGRMVQKMREEMFSKILRMPTNYFHETPSGGIISIILNDANMISEAGFNIITVIAKDGVTIIGLFAWMLYLEWRLTLVSLIAVPIVGFCIRWNNRYLRDLAQKNQNFLAGITQTVHENIDGVREVKTYGGQEYENQRFNKDASLVSTMRVKLASANTANTSFTQFIVSVLLAVVIYFAALRAAHASPTKPFNSGEFMSFLTSMIMLFDPIKRITGIMQSLQRGLIAAEGIFNFLGIPEEKNEGTYQTDTVKGDIHFQNVTFQYPNAHKNSIENFNLDIKSGSVVALVGASGCGKTTTASLIPRFYEVSEGKITLDGVDLRDYELSSLRHHMAFVSQDVVLFNDTVANNIAYGEQAGASEEDIIKALKDANAWQFVEQMPDGIHTFIGENGAKL